MFKQAIRKFSSTKPNNFQVTVCGASGGIGQPLALLLKLNPLVTRLNLYDIVKTLGVATDLSHIDTKSLVCGFEGEDKCGESLKGADVVVVVAGIPRKEGMTRDDLFDINAKLITKLAGEISQNCPEAMLCIATNPLNSMIPVAAEVLKKAKAFDPKRLFGLTALDTTRARKFFSEEMKIDPQTIKIDVICGHSGVTIIPLVSNSEPKFTKDVQKLIKRVQTGGDEVLKAKGGSGTAVLSMAYSTAGFANAVMRGLKGDSNVIASAYVATNVCGTEFFALPVLLGTEGVEKICDIPEMDDYEQELLTKAIEELEKNIKKGIDFGKK